MLFDGVLSDFGCEWGTLCGLECVGSDEMFHWVYMTNASRDPIDEKPSFEDNEASK